MSKAEELANALDMHWIEHFRCHPNDAPMCESAAAELRRLAALEKAIMDAEPVAWMAPHKEHIEFSRPDTVYGSHTIPLYTLDWIKP